MDVPGPFAPFPPARNAACFPLGARLVRASRIIPVFLPFAGCPGQCVFCSQDRQTGKSDARGEQGANRALEEAETLLAELAARPLPAGAELAFYGGTFTALPPPLRRRCLRLFARFRRPGPLRYGRCSTRPDALDAGVLAELAEAGLDMVELGVQSFDDDALLASRRGYGRKEALEGCRIVPEQGLKLGIQLLPGMPGVTPEVFLEDVSLALGLRPDAVRFYPCLVPEGTALSALWREDRYRPWSLEETVSTLGRALAMAWEARIPVIRLSVAPEPGFDAHVLDGPRHPALGSLIQAEALRLTVHGLLDAIPGPPQALRLPQACRGYIYGQKNALKTWWAEAGLPPEKIHFEKREKGLLTWES